MSVGSGIFQLSCYLIAILANAGCMDLGFNVGGQRTKGIFFFWDVLPVSFFYIALIVKQISIGQLFKLQNVCLF